MQVLPSAPRDRRSARYCSTIHTGCRAQRNVRPYVRSYLQLRRVEDQHIALQVLLHHPQRQTIRLYVANLHHVYRGCAHGRGEE